MARLVREKKGIKRRRFDTAMSGTNRDEDTGYNGKGTHSTDIGGLVDNPI